MINNINENESHSIIYKYINGNFLPFQILTFYAINKFLPINGNNDEFLLLISCKNHEIQMYLYDGWIFKQSDVRYTGEAFTKGVSNMRTYYFNNKTLIGEYFFINFIIKNLNN